MLGTKISSKNINKILARALDTPKLMSRPCSALNYILKLLCQAMYKFVRWSWSQRLVMMWCIWSYVTELRNLSSGCESWTHVVSLRYVVVSFNPICPPCLLQWQSTLWAPPSGRAGAWHRVCQPQQWRWCVTHTHMHKHTLTNTFNKSTAYN